MISVDLSKLPSLRPLAYLFALFPGLFFLFSVAVGNPALAKASINHVEGICAFPHYALLVILLGSAFAIGQGFVTLVWVLELTWDSAFRIGRWALRKTLGGPKVYAWLAKFQGAPPKNTLVVRSLTRLILTARGASFQMYEEERQAVWHCLVAATESLLKKRYGIDAERAGGPNGGEWRVWASNLGVRLKGVSENRNVGRTALSCGFAGILALRFAPALADRYYLALCLIFAVSGLSTSVWYWRLLQNRAQIDVLRLRSVLLELQEFSLLQKTKPSDKRTEE